MQMASGLSTITSIQPSTIVWGIILTLIVVTFIISSLTGIDKGIKFLSDKMPRYI
ncbi:protein of unknown function [[Clostridium] ultunense Esp]|uniref:Uncharacterized protein n=2 Tax=Schnuerera ultunensis TaxID=45497 RepID=A0A1M4PLQ9_9FIRM|nr:protein of unknown function [[Clostridium] ultunense Esp]